VSQQRFPVVWLSKVAVITLPVEIDISNADQVREELLSVLNRGAATLIVDMGRTTFCDSAGVNALVRAHKRATANSAEMHLVVGAPGIQRILAITGVDHLMDVYPSVAASLAGADEPGLDLAGADQPGLDLDLGQKASPPHGGYRAALADPGDWAAQPG
jgi:anti-sigma B factor antagonist